MRRYGSYLHLNESRIKIGQYLFLWYGGKAVFVARFFHCYAVWRASWPGLTVMPWPSFMVANVAGAVAWVGIDCASLPVWRRANEASRPFRRFVGRGRGRDHRGRGSIYRAPRAGARTSGPIRVPPAWAPKLDKGLQDHPTVKPVCVLEDALLDMTEQGDIVLGPIHRFGIDAHRCRQADAAAVSSLTLSMWMSSCAGTRQ